MKLFNFDIIFIKLLIHMQLNLTVKNVCKFNYIIIVISKT